MSWKFREGFQNQPSIRRGQREDALGRGCREKETKEPMYAACLREQQGISLAEVEVFYHELVRIRAEWDHTVKPLDCEPKGFN